MQARPDIEPLISFLTIRVKEPDEDDWGKLKHGLMYLKGTLYMKRHMSADSLNTIRCWVDASYGVHWDCKGHTGAMMSMGKGAIDNVSRKHGWRARERTRFTRFKGLPLKTPTVRADSLNTIRRWVDAS